jgi:catechol 2,3-dioxygenase-like lactoylglutathione lyase family enzyme
MSTGKLSHLQINVDGVNLPFYRDLFTFLGWESLVSEDWGVAFSGDGGYSLWFMSGANESPNDVDGVGVNHIGLTADSQAAVDATVSYLQERGVACLFETPRHRPDYASSEDDTYYQVMFASPDGILFEHVYTGPKQD